MGQIVSNNIVCCISSWFSSCGHYAVVTFIWL